MIARCLAVLTIAAPLAIATEPASAGLGLVSWLFDLDDVGRNSALDLSRAMDRATTRLRDMQHELDADVRDYLKVIDTIGSNVTEDVERILSNINLNAEQRLDQANQIVQDALVRVEALEKQAVYDLRALLWEATCTGERFSDTLKRTLGDTVRIVSEAEAELNVEGFGLFPFLSARAEVRKVPLSNPFISYEEVRYEYEAAIAAITEDTPVRFVISAYDNIARMAKLTSCHYQGLATSQLLLQDFVTYGDRARSWALIAGVTTEVDR
jgi:hypothetical protein